MLSLLRLLCCYLNEYVNSNEKNKNKKNEKIIAYFLLPDLGFDFIVSIFFLSFHQETSEVLVDFFVDFFAIFSPLRI